MTPPPGPRNSRIFQWQKVWGGLYQFRNGSLITYHSDSLAEDKASGNPVRLDNRDAPYTSTQNGSRSASLSPLSFDFHIAF